METLMILCGDVLEKMKELSSMFSFTGRIKYFENILHVEHGAEVMSASTLTRNG